MAKYIIGDIHGGFKALRFLFERERFKPEDSFVFLGDYVDGWSESRQVINFLIRLNKNYKCVFLKGNHDELFYDYLKSGKFNPIWLESGGVSTIESYQGITNIEKKKHLVFFENLKDYHLDSENNLFVHAGYTNSKGVQFEYFKRMFFWDRTLWEMVLALDETILIEDLCYPSRLKNYNQIFVGHNATTKYGFDKPFHKQNFWNLDTGAGYDGRLTILELESKSFKQSPKLKDLYPNECGRNKNTTLKVK